MEVQALVQIKLFYLILAILSASALASPPQGTVVQSKRLLLGPKSGTSKVLEAEPIVVVKPRLAPPKKPVVNLPKPGNLPHYFLNTKSDQEVMESPNHFTTKVKQFAEDIHPGDTFEAVMSQKLMVSSERDVPIKARLLNGTWKGALLLGKATLLPDLKRVSINFDKIRHPRSNVIYIMTSSVLGPDGSQGLVGTWHSNFGAFFAGSVASTAVSGLLEASIPKVPTVFGYTSNPDLENAAKHSVAKASSHMGEKLNELNQRSNDFLEVSPYQAIKIVIEERPEKVL